MLISAAEDGNVGVVRVLLGMGPDATDASSKNTALMRATSRGHHEVVQALVIGEETPEQRRARKRNEMLISAAADGDVGVVRVLLNMGPDATDASSKNTALMQATSQGHHEIEALLRDQ
jgi:ankyrin repeat protein